MQLGDWDRGWLQPQDQAGVLGEHRQQSGRGWGVGGGGVLFPAGRKVFQYCNIRRGCSRPCGLNTRPDHMHVHKKFKVDCPGSPSRGRMTQWSSLGECNPKALSSVTYEGHVTETHFTACFLNMLKSRSPGRQRVFKTAIPNFYKLLPWIVIFLCTVELVSA